MADSMSQCSLAIDDLKISDLCTFGAKMDELQTKMNNLQQQWKDAHQEYDELKKYVDQAKMQIETKFLNRIRISPNWSNDMKVGIHHVPNCRYEAKNMMNQTPITTKLPMIATLIPVKKN